MRILLQLVQNASVSVEGEQIAKIEKGYLLFVGFTAGDDEHVLRKMAEKVFKLRIFPDENGKTNLSLSQVGGHILSVSQFTLYANMKEGNRPSFTDCMKPEEAREKFDLFNKILREFEPTLQTGRFQADMKVSLLNEGPFTLILDSRELVN